VSLNHSLPPPTRLHSSDLHAVYVNGVKYVPAEWLKRCGDERRAAEDFIERIARLDPSLGPADLTAIVADARKAFDG
jgi:hypothetical protein